MVSRSRANLEELQHKLAPWFQGKMPQASDIAVSNMKPPEAGFVAETFMFRLDWTEAGQRKSREMVFRRPPLLPVFPDYDLRRQFLVMQRLHGTGIPVPKVFWRVEQDESILGTPFYIMERLPGTTPPDFPLYHSAGSYFDALAAEAGQDVVGRPRGHSQVPPAGLAEAAAGLPGGAEGRHQHH